MVTRANKAGGRVRELGRTRVGGYIQSISFQLNPSSIYPQSIQLNSVQPNSSVNPFSSMHPFNSFGSIHLNTCIHFDSFTSTQFIPAQSVRLDQPSTRFISMPCHVVFSALLVGGGGSRWQALALLARAHMRTRIPTARQLSRVG